MNEDHDVVSLHPTYVVRMARLDDCEAMADLAAQLGYSCTREEVRLRLEEMQNPNAYAVFIAENFGAEIAGWIGAYLFRSVETESCVEISGLVVDEKMRSRGIGKILLQAAEQWARSLGCNTISVHSNIRRTRAHWFYVKNGYHHVKVQKELHKLL
jgi:GNAT superfamily N-acetyltransferase